MYVHIALKKESLERSPIDITLIFSRAISFSRLPENNKREIRVPNRHFFLYFMAYNAPHLVSLPADPIHRLNGPDILITLNVKN